jgi:ABC-2 type transport system ATP-binding protein
VDQARVIVRRSWSVVVAVAVLGALGLAGCSSSPAQGSGSTPTADATTTAAVCHPPVPAHPATATAVPGVPSDWNVTSFDGTIIRAHWFPVHPAQSQRYPTVLMGPGWSESGDTDTSGSGILGQIPIKDLWAAGYNVLTWDPRGFGRSGGAAEVDSPEYEARDVSSLIDWVANRPGVELDAHKNPRIGMVGGSYGGGIQLVTAATDCRIDAIVPEIAWHSLVTSLDKADTPKIGWANILGGLSSSDHVAPTVHQALVTENATGRITAAQRQWFADRGPGALVSRIHIPTLIVQGTVDTLFTLQEGVDNYEILRHGHVPAAMLWFCGGHGVCLTPPGNQQLPVTASIDWLNRYLKGDTSVDTGPGFQFLDQNGTAYSAGSFPVPTGEPVTGEGQGTLPLVSTGGAGPADTSGSDGQLAGLVAPITPGRATNAVDVAIPFGSRSGVVVGAPELSLTYRGTSPPGPRPTRVFAQLVDEKTGLVLGNQITPIEVALDGHTHTTSLPLEMVAFTGEPHATVELQLVATTVAYARPQLGGSIDFTRIHVSLPVAAAIRAR